MKEEVCYNKTLMEKYSKVFSLLHDELSKSIYTYRMFYNFTGDERYISEMVRENTKMLPLQVLQLDKKRDYILYGVGEEGRRLNACLRTLGIKLNCCCDQRAAKGFSEFDGIKVLCPEEASKIEDAVFLIASSFYKTEMYNTLIELGIKEKNIYVTNDNWCMYFSDMDQYFDKDIIKLGDNEMFLDCGAADGFNTEMFLKLSGKNAGAFLFEPLAENLTDLKRFSKIPGVNIIPHGVWDKTCKLTFINTDDRYCGKFCEDDNGIEWVTSIDEKVYNVVDKVTFIKMDIEGAELKALQGAKNTILRDRPRLAISIYHKPEDIYEIPLFIKSLVPEYKFYIRHYSNFQPETILYAV